MGGSARAAGYLLLSAFGRAPQPLPRVGFMAGVSRFVAVIADNYNVIQPLVAQPLIGLVVKVELGVREAKRTDDLAVPLAELSSCRAGEEKS